MPDPSKANELPYDHGRRPHLHIAVDILTERGTLYKTTDVATEDELLATVRAWRENVETLGFELRVRKAR